MWAEVERPLWEVKDAQSLRLYGDILMFVPLFVWMSVSKELNSFQKVALVSMALTTFLYNTKYAKS